MPPGRFDRLPPILAARRIEGFDTEVSPAAAAMVEAAFRFMSDPEGHLNLVMVGRPGAGKSHIAAAIANAEREALQARYEQAVADRGDRWPALPVLPWWVNVPETMIRVRSFADDTRGLWLDIGEHRGLVVLDDLGRERITEFSGEQLYVAVNARYEHGRRTIVTSNMSLNELSEAGYGPVVSRLSERGELLDLRSAVDYRLKRLGASVAPTGGGTSAGAEQDRSGTGAPR